MNPTIRSYCQEENELKETTQILTQGYQLQSDEVKFQRLEGENKMLRKKCNEYLRENLQLRERSVKSERLSSENEYLIRTIACMRRDYDSLVKRYRRMEEENETCWRKAQYYRQLYYETFQKMRRQRSTRMLEGEQEQLMIENRWPSKELDKGKSRAAQPKRAIFSTTDGLLLSTDIGSAHLVSSRLISRASSGYGSAALKDLEVTLAVYDHLFNL